MQIRNTIISAFAIAFSFVPGSAQIPIQVSGTLPVSINNSTQTCFPPIVDQGQRESCGNATGIGYIFNYEINCARSLSGKEKANQYPFFHTYDFLNEGDEMGDPDHDYFRHFLAAWKITQENGIPNVNDFGASDLNSTRWLSGYDKYYRAMQNRVDKIDSFAITDTAGLRKMKQWLKDHGNGSSVGGVFAFTANIYGTQEITVPSGVEAGKSMVKAWGSNQSSSHCMAIVGYNDSVHYDFNGDGKFTNNLDISTEAGVKGADGRITMADWETGAFIAANSWGAAVWDNGICYAPYRTLVISPPNGGLLSGNRVYYLTVKKTYSPRLALKINMTKSIRNTIALSVGISADQAAATPMKLRRFDRQFTYSGGAYPLCGKGAEAAIEIGLDISDLLDSIPGFSAGTFFLRVDSKGGTGSVDSLSLMDYTGGTLKKTTSAQTAVSIVPGTATAPVATYIGVAASLTGLIPAINRAKGPQTFQLRQMNGTIRIRVPFEGNGTVSLFNVQGKMLYSCRFTAPGAWIDLPKTVINGCYLLCVRPERGPVSILKTGVARSSDSKWR